MPQGPHRDRSGGCEHRRPLELLVGKLVQEDHESIELAAADQREVLGLQQLRELGVADRCRVREGLLK